MRGPAFMTATASPDARNAGGGQIPEIIQRTADPRWRIMHRIAVAAVNVDYLRNRLRDRYPAPQRVGNRAHGHSLPRHGREGLSTTGGSRFSAAHWCGVHFKPRFPPRHRTSGVPPAGATTRYKPRLPRRKRSPPACDIHRRGIYVEIPRRISGTGRLSRSSEPLTATGALPGRQRRFPLAQPQESRRLPFVEE